ncbi:MAG: hypothetical protein EA376_09220 [Phycisphaeraceae bacterium]|nr:MAG: hypothetical protein EA376_09220 [Phycisphaeraceae bacterium]
MLVRLIVAFMIAVVGVAGVGPGVVGAQGQKDGGEIPCEFPMPDRVVVVGMIAGHHDLFVDILQRTDVIDEHENWIGGETHLVQMGDLFGTGPYLTDSAELLMKLEEQAAAAGGKVHVLHARLDHMILRNDLSRVNIGPQHTHYTHMAGPDTEEKRAQLLEEGLDVLREQFADDPRLEGILSGYRNHFEMNVYPGGPEFLETLAPGSPMGDWMRSHNVAIRLGDVIFVSTGISEDWAHLPLPEINDRIRRLVDEVPVITSLLVDQTNPVWWTELSRSQDQNLEDRIREILKSLNARAMVVGHSPERGSVRRGNIYHVESKIPEMTGEAPAALVIENGERFRIFEGVSAYDLGAPEPMD